MILPLDFGILGFHGTLKIEGKKLEPPGSKCAPLSDPSNSVCAPVVRWASRGGQYDPHANDWFEDMQDAWIGVILLSPAFHFHDLPFFTVLFHPFYDLCIFFWCSSFSMFFFLGPSVSWFAAGHFRRRLSPRQPGRLAEIVFLRPTRGKAVRHPAVPVLQSALRRLLQRQRWWCLCNKRVWSRSRQHQLQASKEGSRCL